MTHRPAGLEQPLPPQLAGISHAWLTEYKRYPVFSRHWIRLRLRPALLVCSCVLLGVIVAVLLSTDDFRALGGVVMLVANMALPLSLGPWLGHQVRSRGWPQEREGRALLAVLVAVSIGTVLLTYWLGEPVKQAVAQATGSVDAQGRRLPARIVIGITMNDGNRVTGDPNDAGTAPGLLSSTTLTQAFLLFWLAGGMALFDWRRERNGLALLQQQQALERAQAEQREAELRLSVLAAQVEPHFLFNTLAGVRSAITTDPARAAEMVDRLVDYLRASIPRLREDGSLQATVGAQAEAVRAYLALMRARMQRMRFSIDIPDALASARCPPLMLISMAENAVKHGVEPKIGAAEVRLVASSPAPGRLRLSVLDDGVGFNDAGSGSGLGLTNIRARLAQLYGEAAELSLHARPGGGVEAAIELPLAYPS